MKNIETILESAGITGDKAKEIADLVNSNYKTIAEYQSNRDQRDKALAQVEELTSKVEELGANAGEVEKLKTELESVRKGIADKEAAAKAEADKAAFAKEFDSVLDGRKFVNDLTRNAVLDKCWNRHQANPDENIKAAFDAVVGDTDGIFAAKASVRPPAGEEAGAEAADGFKGMVAKLFPTD